MEHSVERALVADLRPHPRNYRHHPDDQLDHLAQSIREHGCYRNVVVACDNTILAGHGVVQAIDRMGLFGPRDVPIIRMPFGPDDPRALKILAGDNELGKLAEPDDRALSEILRDVLSADDLLGTGFDARSLSALVMVTRPVEEIRDKNEAAEWVGMPEFDAGKPMCKLTLMFSTPEERDALVAQIGVRIADRSRDGSMWSAWWPRREAESRIGVLFTE